MQRKYRWWFASSVVLTIAVLCWWVQTDSTPSAALHKAALLSMVQGDYSQAEKLAIRLSQREGQLAAGRLLAAQAAAKADRPQAALMHYALVPDDGSASGLQALLEAGDLQMNLLRKLTAAEQNYHRILVHAPHDVTAHYRLAYILGMEGRSWEAVPHRLELLRADRAEPVQVILLALNDTAEENIDQVHQFATASPDDPAAMSALAWTELRHENFDKALPLLQKVVRSAPQLLAAQAWYGRLLIDQPESEFPRWNSNLPANAALHPEIWCTRGRWALKNAQPKVAIRCFWEATRLDPEHMVAQFQLGSILASEGKMKQAQPFLRRAELLGNYTIAAKSYQLVSSPQNIQTCVRCATELGLRWEAWGWTQLLDRATPRRPAIQQQLKSLRSQLDATDASSLVRSDPEFHPAKHLDVNDYPLPDWRSPQSSNRAAQAHQVTGLSKIAFTDSAIAAGIQFQYRNGSQVGSGGEYMYEISGGGVAVLDYDRDGWPDMYLTQGTDWPPDPAQRRHMDQLYRNGADDQFRAVTQQAGISEVRFSQGPAIGDVDQDGFPDLFISNIGTNTLYHNNGDGTFTDITQQAGVTGDGAWTISSVLADLNGDTLPDLYNVNYLNGRDIYSRPCGTTSSEERSGCSPLQFNAAPDQFFLNLGDGRFQELTKAAGFDVPDGKGMGVVAADFDGSGKLSLFVANDAVPNFFFVNHSTMPGDLPRFLEQAYASGLAVDADGRAQACMGVAAGDANVDGLLDLYITNYRAESKTLYLNQSALSFLDDTRRSGLREPGFDLLGFGTQFLDADLDGLPDLIVTNGHIGNFSHSGIPYEMRPQFFQNVGTGRFVELTAPTLGPFFKGVYLGRGLARIDWNRDGLDDCVISHVSTPVALLTNQTQTANNFITFQLCGITSDRDAIGTRVTVTSGNKRWSQQLVAGDGYQASNHRQLIFGLGETTRIDKVEVLWQSGIRQALHDFQINCEYLLLENRTTPIRLPK